MLITVILPDTLEDIRKNLAFKQELATINMVDSPAIDAMLRPAAITRNGTTITIPHAQKLTNYTNLRAIKKQYGFKKYESFLMDIDVQFDEIKKK